VSARRPARERIAAAEAARDAGMALVEEHADPRAILHIDAVIGRWNASGRIWSANDIRDELPVADEHLVGARVRAASQRRPREMYPVGYTPSTLLSTHAHPIRTWQGAEAYEAQSVVSGGRRG
jgi:hypothetical protein